MYVFKHLGIYLTGIIIGVPVSVSIWAQLTSYDENMPLLLVSILQIPKVVAFSAPVFLAGYLILRLWKYNGELSISRVVFYAGILYGSVWNLLYYYSYPVLLPPEGYEFIYFVFVLGVVPALLSSALSYCFCLWIYRALNKSPKFSPPA